MGLLPVAITVALYDDNTAIITPSSVLILNKVYSIVVGTGVKDSAGNSLASQASSNFTTRCRQYCAPTVTYQYPADSSTAVPKDVQICLVFSSAGGSLNDHCRQHPVDGWIYAHRNDGSFIRQKYGNC